MRGRAVIIFLLGVAYFKQRVPHSIDLISNHCATFSRGQGSPAWHHKAAAERDNSQEARTQAAPAKVLRCQASREGFAACPNPLNAHADWTREGPTSRPPLPSQVLPLSLHASGYGIGIEVFVIVLANGRISRMGEAAHWLSGAVTWSPD